MLFSSRRQLLVLIVSLLMLRSTPSPSAPSASDQSTQRSNKRRRHNDRSTQRRRDELERMRFHRGSQLSNHTPSTLSSQSHSSSIPSILVNLFGSSDSTTSNQHSQRGNELSQLDSIVSSHHGSPPASQISLPDEYQRSIDTLMSSIPFSEFDFSPQEEYVRFNDADSAIASVVDLESLNLSIDHCFDLIDHGVQPSKPLHENKKMKDLQKSFLKSIHDCNGGKAKDGMSHCFQCKERWFDTVKDKRIRYELVGQYLSAYSCKRCGKDNGLHSKSNDMDPWHKLDHLKLPKLNDIEQMLISKVHSYMRVYRLQGKLIFYCVLIYKTCVCLQYVLFFEKGGGGVGYKGQILNIEQDISSIAKQLPLMPDEIPCFLVRKSNQSSANGYRDFKINKDNILLWLKFLKKHNRFYSDLDLGIAEDRLEQIPIDDDGSIQSSLRMMEEEEVEDAMSNETNADNETAPRDSTTPPHDDFGTTYTEDQFDVENMNQRENGPETGGASGEATPLDVIEDFAHRPPTNGLSEEQRKMCLLQEVAPNARPPADDPIAWPTPGSFVNDFQETGLLSKAFPTLFPYASGDPTCRDRNAPVTMDKAGKHFLKYSVNLKDAQRILEHTCVTDQERNAVKALYNEESNMPWIYPFVQNDRFVHFIQNTVERHRAFGQRSFWLSKNSDYSTMTETDIADLIKGGGEPLKQLLSSMQSFNANVNGSPQYLYKKRKLLENLIEQKGICSLWFTLSMADNHWKDMFVMMNRDKDGKKTDFPVFESVQAEASWKRKFVRANPHLVDAYFNERVQSLFKEVFSEKGIEIEWLWFRIEYQGRGAPHVHGCLRLKRDPGLARHAKVVFEGRAAALKLRKLDKLAPADDFEAYELSSDDFADDVISLPLIRGTITELKSKVQKAKHSHAVIVALHDYLLTTTNSDPPIDAESKERSNDTFFKPGESVLPHPSAINPLDCINDENAFKNLYCRSCNVQSRHKHQAYCDKNHDRREMAKADVRAGTLGTRQQHPDKICVNCRFSYVKPLQEKTHVYIEQKVKGKDDNATVLTRIKLASKRNDGWMNSHMRSIMEVSFWTRWHSLKLTDGCDTQNKSHTFALLFTCRFGVLIWTGNSFWTLEW